MSTVNEALKSLILALGGDPESMYDNTTVSDYIKDLETAMQAGGSGVKIDDTTASDSTVYSSSKTESLIPEIPEPELPAVTSEDIGEALIVESDGEGGAQWGKSAIPSGVSELVISISWVSETESFISNKTFSEIKTAYENGYKLSVDMTDAGEKYYSIPLTYVEEISNITHAPNTFGFSSVIDDQGDCYVVSVSICESLDGETASTEVRVTKWTLS